MSEHINPSKLVPSRLLSSVSAVALLGVFALESHDAKAAGTFLADSSQPPLWIELGGDFESISGKADQWMPDSTSALAGSGAHIRKDPANSLGLEGKIAYQFEHSDWKVWAAARYGRSQRGQDFHTQTAQYYALGFVRAYTDTTRHLENHMIVDFEAGKDVGLGLFSEHSRSTIGVGIRIAQFSVTGDDFVSSKPQYSGVFRQQVFFHTAKLTRRTSAMGPTASWDSHVPLISLSDSNFALDWGVNGALLFGKQKTMLDTTNRYRHQSEGYPIVVGTTSANVVRRHTQLIPNLGAMAALSFNLPAAKMTVGYRADFFFSGMDGGVNAYRGMTRSFYGPFATISVGIGG
ncbi:MAG TPA: hypothetical protein VK759_04260 [Rhizomicrobium sp.]|nr:hypothetical protein [Rhizomicrobium sp.]